MSIRNWFRRSDNLRDVISRKKKREQRREKRRKRLIKLVQALKTPTGIGLLTLFGVPTFIIVIIKVVLWFLSLKG